MDARSISCGCRRRKLADDGARRCKHDKRGAAGLRRLNVKIFDKTSFDWIVGRNRDDDSPSLIHRVGNKPRGAGRQRSAFITGHMHNHDFLLLKSFCDVGHCGRDDEPVDRLIGDRSRDSARNRSIRGNAQDQRHRGDLLGIASRLPIRRIADVHDAHRRPLRPLRNGRLQALGHRLGGAVVLRQKSTKLNFGESSTAGRTVAMRTPLASC